MAINVFADERIALVVGRTGGGKSLFCADLIWRTVMQDRRPCFTNVPLKYRVIRRFAERTAGSAIANLIVELTEEHFRAFLERYWALEQFIRACKEDRLPASMPPKFLALRRERVRRLTESDAREAFLQLHGPHVVRPKYGEDGSMIERPNWIAGGALVVIDEAQRWFPNPHLQRGSAKTREPMELQEYLTMHRHLSHQIIMTTQRPRQLSATIKSLAHHVQLCANREDHAIGGTFVRGKHIVFLGKLVFRVPVFPILRWDRYHADQIESLEEVQPSPGEEPIAYSNIFPALPCWQWLFRIYSTQSTGGSAADVRREREAMLRDAGLMGDGWTEEEIERMAARNVRRTVRVGRWIARQTVRLASLAVVVAVTAAVVSPSAEKMQSDIDAAIAAAVERGELMRVQQQGRGGAQTSGIHPPPVPAGVISSIGPGYVRISGQRVALNETFGVHEHVLSAVNHQTRYTIWSASWRRLDSDTGEWLDDVQLYSWRLGEPARALGSIRDIGRFVADPG